jgi:SHS2 domain-containing protein
MSGQFRFLEDVALADSAFEASGASPSELFEAAWQALIETMVNPQTVGVRWSRVLELREESLEGLLFEWLSAIVYLKDAEGVLYHDAHVEVTEEAGQSAWRLRGTLRGEAIDPSRHELRADVKAVTKHLYGIRRENGRWVARVVLDI